MSQKALKPGKSSLTERQRRIYEFLDNTRTGVLATVDPNGEPHATVIYHSIEDGFVISFLTRNDTKKYDNLIRNNHVVLVVFEPRSQTVAQVIGKAVEIKDGFSINEVAANVFKTALEQEGGMPPLVKLESGEYTAFRIKPDQIKMAMYANSGSGDHTQIFESIESFQLNCD